MEINARMFTMVGGIRVEINARMFTMVGGHVFIIIIATLPEAYHDVIPRYRDTANRKEILSFF